LTEKSLKRKGKGKGKKEKKKKTLNENGTIARKEQHVEHADIKLYQDSKI